MVTKDQRKWCQENIVGLIEIAPLCGVKRQTVDKWRWAGKLPEPDLTISNRPLWFRETIEAWANSRAAA